MNSKLPVGSVIKIKNKKDRYIIIGKSVKVTEKVFDYCCVIYPYGYLVDKTSIYYFNDTEVECAEFIGNINY